MSIPTLQTNCDGQARLMAIVTNTRVPARQGALLDRARLRTLLDEAVTKAVTIICAPAGSGKTSMLRTWIEHARRTYRIVFVSARSEHDEQGFWLSLLAQLQNGPCTPTPTFDGAAMVNRLLSELGESNPPTLLIIDDAHDLGQDALVNLASLLSRLPSHVRAVVATRRDLRLGTHQLRVEGHLSDIRTGHLTFTESEARELFASSGITLSDDAVRTLSQRTEGWAAGLRLAALSLAVEDDPETFVAHFSGSNRVVADYLMAEMLERQPPHVQQVLLATSILERVNGELADLLSETSGSDQIFLGLEEVNGFVVSVDNERRWFRYHHLFRELLQLELRRTRPSLTVELHRRAASWFAQHGKGIEAIQHRQAAADWELAAQLLADNLFELLMSGRDETIRALLEAFPNSERSRRSELSLVNAALALQQGRFADASSDLDIAELHMETLPAQRQPAFRVGIATLRLGLARQQGQVNLVVDQVMYLASPEATRLISGTAFNPVLRAAAVMNLGIAEMWSGRMADAERHLREGAALANRVGQQYIEIICLSNLGFILKLDSFAVSLQHTKDAIALAERYGFGSDPVIVPALETIGGILLFTGEFNAAEPWLARAANIVSPNSNPPVELLMYLAKGMLRASRGQLRAALTEFESAERMQSSMLDEHLLGAQATAWAIGAKARLGMLDEARASLAATPSSRINTAEMRNVEALLALESGEPGMALKKLEDVFEGRLHIKHDFILIESYLLAAHAHQVLSNEGEMRKALENALAIAERDRLILPFFMTRSLEMIERLPRTATAHVALLLDIVDRVRGSSSRSAFAEPLVDGLSQMELRVLRFLPTNLSRPEIARELKLSVNTVNTHMRNIYSKLDAANRSEAVERGRVLRLLAH
jgi:LuxR family transcriptional regulator, maltose regulon positive regulatory protein